MDWTTIVSPCIQSLCYTNCLLATVSYLAYRCERVIFWNMFKIKKINTCVLPTYRCVFKVIEAVVGQNEPPSLPRLHPAACREKTHNVWVQAEEVAVSVHVEANLQKTFSSTCHIWFWSSALCVIRLNQRRDTPSSTPLSLKRHRCLRAG